MSTEARLPDLRGADDGADDDAIRNAGWHVLDHEGVSVPTLGRLRACAHPSAELDPCRPRVIDWDLDDGAVLVALPDEGLTLSVAVTPSPDVPPILHVEHGETTRRIVGERSGRRWRFERVIAPDAPTGAARFGVEGHDGTLHVLVALGSTTPGPLPTDPCALTLAPRVRTVAAHAGALPARWPRPPLLAVDPSTGRIVSAWSADACGRTAVPEAERQVLVRQCGIELWSVRLDEPVRDAMFIGDELAVATSTRVRLYAREGVERCMLSGFESVVGLGAVGSSLVVLDAHASRTVRVFRTDGVELAPPPVFPDRGYPASIRSAAFTFDEGRCVLRVEPTRITRECSAAPARDLTPEEARFFELVSDLPVLRRRLGFETRGEVILGPVVEGSPLDARRPDAVWQRIVAEGELPDGTTLGLATRTAADSTALDPRILSGWSRLVTVGPEHRTPIAAPGDPRLAVLDAQVLADAGRFLALRIVLRGDGRSSPAIRALTAIRDASSIARFLPRVFEESTPEDRFLERWLALFESTVFDGVALRMREYAALFDPRTAPDAMLPFLMGWLAMPLVEAVAGDPARMRRILVAAPHLAPRRGTPGGLVDLIAAYTDVPVQIRESFVGVSRFVLGGCGAAGAGGIVLGCDTVLSLETPGVVLGESALGCAELTDCDRRTGGQPHGFEVLVPASRVCSSATFRLIEALVELEKPAHTRARVREVPAGFVLGTGAILGQEVAGDFDRRAPDPTRYGVRLGAPTRPRPLGHGFALDRGIPLPSAEPRKLATPHGETR